LQEGVQLGWQQFDSQQQGLQHMRRRSFSRQLSRHGLQQVGAGQHVVWHSQQFVQQR
jgi:hypothetical protein